MALTTPSTRHKWVDCDDPDIMALVTALHQAQGLAFSQARTIWSRHGLTAAEFDVLATLRSAAAPYALTPSSLYASVLITSGGLTKVMRQLEERQLVSRPRQEGDQRVKPVKLTPTGKRLVEKVMTETAAATSTWMRNTLTAQDIGLLTELLEKIASTAR